MQKGDIKTKEINKHPSGSFVVVIERDWLDYLGFSESELKKENIKLVFKAEVSDRKKLKFIGFGKPEE